MVFAHTVPALAKVTVPPIYTVWILVDFGGGARARATLQLLAVPQQPRFWKFCGQEQTAVQAL